MHAYGQAPISRSPSRFNGINSRWQFKFEGTRGDFKLLHTSGNPTHELALLTSAKFKAWIRWESLSMTATVLENDLNHCDQMADVFACYLIRNFQIWFVSDVMSESVKAQLTAHSPEVPHRPACWNWVIYLHTYSKGPNHPSSHVPVKLKFIELPKSALEFSKYWQATS